MMAKKKNKQPVQHQPPEPGNFWTPNDKRQFHEAVAALQEKKIHMPDGDPVGYRHTPRATESIDLYVLSAEQELQLADDIAFLFPAEEKGETVTATAIEEHDTGKRLVLRIASNEPPKQNVVDEFLKIVDVVQKYAIKGRGRDAALEELFDTILEARATRILQRLATPNGGWRKGRIVPSLHDRLQVKLNLIKSSRLSTWSKARRKQFNLLCQEVEQLLQMYKKVDTAKQGPELKAALRASVMMSFELYARNGKKTLAQRLADLGLDLTHSGTKEVFQVDKIGRYYTSCIDILRIVRFYKDREMFRNISLQLCGAHAAKKPPGATTNCHVHGEVKLVMHYEHHPHHPPPRAIGSSKSMCFLCGLFLETHGRYWMSHCHKRLYPMWTIPDVHWIDSEQAGRFQGIVRAMTWKMVMLNNKAKSVSINYPVESRCHLPFEYPTSSPSAASSTETIRPMASSARSLTPTQESYRANLEIISHSSEALHSTVEYVSAHHALPLTTIDEHTDLRSLLPTPPADYPDVETICLGEEPLLAIVEDTAGRQPSPLTIVKEQPPLHDALPTPPASPIITSRPPALPSPSLPAPLSRTMSRRSSATPSYLTLLPSAIRLSHGFAFKGPDVEITISGTLFIFQFRSISTGTLSITWHDSLAPREPSSPDASAGLYGSLGDMSCHHIDLGSMGDEAVQMRRNGGRSCEFTVRIDSVTAVKVEVQWDEEN